jgi:hypothetical protein
VKVVIELRWKGTRDAKYVTGFLDAGQTFNYDVDLKRATVFDTPEFAVQAIVRRNDTIGGNADLFSLVPVEVPEPAIRRLT